MGSVPCGPDILEGTSPRNCSFCVTLSEHTVYVSTSHTTTPKQRPPQPPRTTHIPCRSAAAVPGGRCPLLRRPPGAAVGRRDAAAPGEPRPRGPRQPSGGRQSPQGTRLTAGEGASVTVG